MSSNYITKAKPTENIDHGDAVHFEPEKEIVGLDIGYESDPPDTLNNRLLFSGLKQNLWETFVADTGSASADSTTDTFTIVGGNNVTTSISGDVLTIDTDFSLLSWQEPVLDKDSTAPPGSPTTGDRYIVASVATGAWVGQENNIAEWDGATWGFTTSTEGFACWIQDDDKVFVFNGTSWVALGTTVSHNNTDGLQGGQAGEYYHLTSAEYASLGDVVGPSSSTDNAIVRFDLATGKLLQDSNVTINDNGDIQLDITNTNSPAEGATNWNSEDGTLQTGLPGGNVILQHGQEVMLPKGKAIGSNIDNGQLVYVSGASGSRPELTLAKADSHATAEGTIAMATEDILQNQNGYFTAFGLVRDVAVPTATYTDGDTLYLSAATAGDFTNVAPSDPNHCVQIGYVIKAHDTEGVIFVAIDIKTNHAENILVEDTGGYFDATNVETALQEIGLITSVFTTTKEPNGFIDPSNDVTCTFTNGTRQLDISPSASEFTYYSEGTAYTKDSTNSVVIDNTEGLHYIYFNGATLTATTSFDSSIITDKAIVAIIYWDATNSKQIYFGREYLHTTKMAGLTHDYLHNTLGFALESGGALGDILSDENGSLASHAQFSNELTEAWDEDAYFSLSARLSSATIPIYYRSGVDGNGIFRIDESASFPVLTTGTGRAAWNELTGGSWQLTELTNNDFVLAHVVATNDTDRPFAVFMGQSDYANIRQARNGIETEVNNLILNGLPLAEFTFLGSMILQSSDSYSNTVKSRIRTLSDGSDYLDLRGVFTGRSGSTGSVTDHAALANLQGGQANEYYHLTSAEYAGLNISNWDTAYTHSQGDGSDHSDVAANTALAHAESHTVASHSDTTATGTELNTLTDGDDASSLHVHKAVVITKIIADDADLATGDGKAYFTIPEELNGYNLTSVMAAVYTVSSSGTPTFQIHNVTDGNDMLSTAITIDASEYNSTSAATAPVIDTDYDDVSTGDRIRFDVDVAGTGTKGGEIKMTFTKP